MNIVPTLFYGLLVFKSVPILKKSLVNSIISAIFFW